MNIVINLEDYRPEDGGILDCWMDNYGADWLYVSGFESWFKWAGTHWKKDECQALYKQIQTLMDAMNKAAKTEVDKATAELAALGKDASEQIENMLKARKVRFIEWVNATKRSKNRVSSVEGMAQAQRAVSADSLDVLNVLNLKNGTLNMNTLELQPHNRDDLLTYELDYQYDPQAKAPRGDRFFAEVIVKAGTTETDTTLCKFLQEFLGYCLTNDTKHEVMAWLAGEGGNGKTIVITLLQWLLGPLACSVDFSTIGQQGNYDMASVQGRRVVFSTESEKGGKLAEGYIKRIVSGERINVRPIYGAPFEFKSIAKIVWAMNDKPVVRDTSNSVWRRLRLIPFNRVFTEADKDTDLLTKLKDELPGILNFCLNGLRRLRQQGHFTEAEAVKEAIKEYRHESNPVAQWLDENTVRITQFITPGKNLYTDYEQWCKANGRQAMNSVHWGREIKRLGLESKVTNEGKTFAIGILQPTTTGTIS